MKAQDRLIVALDVDSYDRTAELVELLSPHTGWFKIGSVMFTREGARVCRLVKNAGAKLFLDLKYHDIPNTVRGAVLSAASLDVDMLTLHTSGGESMMRAAVEAREEAGGDMIIVGVTVLTHLDLDEFQSIFASERAPEQAVPALAELAQRAGLNGVVASARELPAIKERVGSDFVVVTPGIRMADGATDDQTRVATPAAAIADGADYLVVGRPIIAAADPVAACVTILDDMRSAV